MSKAWIVISLTLVGVFLVLPPFLHSYIYPNGGDDSGVHMVIMEQITLTHPIPDRVDYAGEWIIGYPLILMRDYLHVPLATSYMYFAYLSLIGAMLSIYFVTAKLLGSTIGLLAMVSSIFIIGIILQQFLAGLVFNLINMSIIFLWLTYLTVHVIVKKYWKLLAVPIILLIVFLRFHATGSYLSLSVFAKIGNAFSRFSHVPSEDLIKYAVVATCLTAISGLGIYFAVKQWSSNREASLFIVIIAVACVGLTVVALPVLTISPVPVRQLQDAINLAVIIGVFVLSLWLKRMPQYQLNALVLVVGVLSMAMVSPQWLRDFSAVKPVDKQVIAYVNTLSGSAFYGNEYLAPWIYSHYLNKDYKAGSGIYISRSVPMTMRTNPDNDTYWQPEARDVLQPSNVRSVRYFEDGGIKISVAEVTP